MPSMGDLLSWSRIGYVPGAHPPLFCCGAGPRGSDIDTVPDIARCFNASRPSSHFPRFHDVCREHDEAGRLYARNGQPGKAIETHHNMRETGRNKR